MHHEINSFTLRNGEKMNNFVLGFCNWDILAAIALGVSVAALIVQQMRHKDRMKKLQTESK